MKYVGVATLAGRESPSQRKSDRQQVTRLVSPTLRGLRLLLQILTKRFDLEKHRVVDDTVDLADLRFHKGVDWVRSSSDETIDHSEWDETE